MNEHRPPDHVRIALEMPIPSLVTQHDHRVAARTLIVRRREPASHDRIDADDLKEICGDQRDGHHAAIDTQIDFFDGRVRIGEDAGLRSHRIEHGTREWWKVAAGLWRPLHLVHLADVGDVVDAKEHRVQDREEHRHHAQSDGHGRDDCECRQRRLHEGAQRVLNIPNGVVDDGGAAFVAALIGRQRRRAETSLGA
jgi:hypothetical protein